MANTITAYNVDGEKKEFVYDIPMTLQDYQAATALTAIYPPDTAISYLVAGLCSEAGEVAGKFKKLLRDNTEYESWRQMMLKEIGDVLWYTARLADELDADLGKVAEMNILKLIDRGERGQLKGEGDER
jgi:NTP pyrophosphatase (non-canonical NTP hydrolase)